MSEHEPVATNPTDTAQVPAESNGSVSRDAFNALLQKVAALESRVSQLADAGTTAQSQAIRDAVSDKPKVFSVTTRDGESVSLALHHPSFYKLELIGDEIEAILDATVNDKTLRDETSVQRFVLAILRDKALREHLYRVLQIAFDPVADPEPTELSVNVNHIKLLNPVDVIDALIKQSTPFFIQLLRLLQLRRSD